jgi:hypothetical protein
MEKSNLVSPSVPRAGEFIQLSEELGFPRKEML